MTGKKVQTFQKKHEQVHKAGQYSRQFSVHMEGGKSCHQYVLKYNLLVVLTSTRSLLKLLPVYSSIICISK